MSSWVSNKTVGPIVTDYASLSMKFQWLGSDIHLHGITTSTVTEISPTQVKRLHNTKFVSGYFHLAMDCSTNSTNLSKVDWNIAPIILKYNKLFQEPQNLPRVPENSHRICLELNSTPVNIRPYRYPVFQKKKNQIEKLIHDILIQE